MISKSVIRRGFTLIELLVVIGIIGVLASIVISELSKSRALAANASIKANLSAIRAQAALYYQNNASYGSYTGLCPSSGSGTVFHDPVVMRGVSEAIKVSGATNNHRCHSNTTAWAASMPLKIQEGSFTHWCVDSSGRSKGRSSFVASANAGC